MSGANIDAKADHEHELLVQRVIMAITTASVVHDDKWLETIVPGRGKSKRSLGYYLGVGIDYYRHPYARHEALLRRAAEQAIEAIAAGSRRAKTPQVAECEASQSVIAQTILPSSGKSHV